MEKERKEEKNVKWVLIISLIMFFVLKWWYFLDHPFPYVFFDFWFFIYLINILSVILAITFATLNKAGLWETEITYHLTVFFFILSMTLLSVSHLQLILRVAY
jgi:hypothetical protein